MLFCNFCHSEYIAIFSQTSGGCLMFYRLGMNDSIRTVYDLIDSPNPNLKRDSAELFVKENIPPISLFLVHE